MDDPLTIPCPAAPLVRRWWEIRPRRAPHDWYVRWSASPPSHYTQDTPLRASGYVLALDSGARDPRCVIHCVRCGLEQPNTQAPVAAVMYALQDAGMSGLAHVVGRAHIVAAGAPTDGGAR